MTKSICKNNLNDLKIDAMCEYFTLSEEVMINMKKAGYYKLRIGIETASEKIAQQMNLGKKFNFKKLYEILKIAKKIGLKMYGTFTIGGLGSNSSEDEKTVKMIYELISQNLLNDLQVSINTPQPGTPFYKISKEKGYFITEDWNLFDGGKGSVLSYPDYPKNEIDNMFREALNSYDKGLMKRALSSDFFNIVKFKLDSIIKDSDNILMIRSYRVWLVKLIIDALKKLDYKRISLLCQSEVQNEFLKYQLNKTILYGTGFINVDSINKNIISEINNDSYKSVIVPVRNIRIRNYNNVLMFLDRLDIKKKILIDSFGEIKVL